MRQVFDIAPDHDHLGNFAAQSAIFPDGQAVIVSTEDDGNRSMRYSRWGWNKARFGWVTNVRNLGGWPWKHVIEDRTQRCLVPASSFSEYHPTETIPGSTGKPIKAASWFRVKGESAQPPFAFAGVMRRWDWDRDGLRRQADEALRDTGESVTAMAFLTTEANAVVAPIHPKAMPVILRTAEEFETWLHGSAQQAAALQRPLPDDALELVFTGAKSDPAG